PAGAERAHPGGPHPRRPARGAGKDRGRKEGGRKEGGREAGGRKEVSQAAPAVRGHWDDLQKWALLAGAAGLALCALGAVLDVERFLQSWLVAFLYWLALPLGGVAI